MEVKTITMPREKAKEEWRTYLALLRTRKEQYLREFKDAYWQLARGRKILDIYEVFKAAGVDDQERPKLAIAPTFAERIRFSYWTDCAKFYGHGGGMKYNVVLPKGVLPKHRRSWWDNNGVETAVPVVPAQFLPLGKFGYYVLWEARDWENVPKDPILLRRLSKNLFAVLAAWRLTKLERAVVAGRL